MKKVVNVGIGEFKVAKAPAVLVTHNLGSCVGVALYDVYHKIGGLAHITLPSYRDMGTRNKNSRDAKFADSAIPLMIEMMEEAGAKLNFTVAKIAGGADMFGLPSNIPFKLDVGRQNVDKVKYCLKKYGIILAAEEVLGNIPRSMELDLDTGKVTLRTSQRKERFL
ncbi:chemotaxis protein CheD [Candidatus Aerophobetes bacterium]|nr:chemotaxis protein CheD [Candidatus Aerophobetes bacterium]